MFLEGSSLYKEDLHRACDSFDFSALKSKSFFITGCNGLICSTVVDLLWQLNLEKNLQLSLFLATRSGSKTKSRFPFWNEKNVTLVHYDATEKLTFLEKADFYIHGASNASPDMFVKEPVQTMDSNIFGTHELLDAATKHGSRILYVSSSEVYGQIQKNEPLDEKDYGFMDILNPHSSYGMSKRTAETLCISYSAQYGTDVVIARPGHIFGPTAGKNDKRVSSSFMFDAAEGKNLVLKSAGEQLRSYTYCLDCATALLFILLYGKAGKAYNISNPNSICTIADMARHYAEYTGVRLTFDLPEQEETAAFNPMKNSSLDSTRLEELGWRPLFTKKEGFEHSIQITKEMASGNEKRAHNRGKEKNIT